MSDFSKEAEHGVENVDMVIKALSEMGEYISLTRGCSMRPLFREHKDVVVIKPVDRPLKKGDVVLYPNENSTQYVLHRIMRFKGDILVIRGDNNLFTEYIKREKIVGILSEFSRGGVNVNPDKCIKYKLYTFYICHFYYLRYIVKKARPILGRLKRKIFKK